MTDAGAMFECGPYRCRMLRSACVRRQVKFARGTAAKGTGAGGAAIAGERSRVAFSMCTPECPEGAVSRRLVAEE